MILKQLNWILLIYLQSKKFFIVQMELRNNKQKGYRDENNDCYEKRIN